MLEPDNGKLLCPVPRGLDGGNVILATRQRFYKGSNSMHIIEI